MHICGTQLQHLVYKFNPIIMLSDPDTQHYSIHDLSDAASGFAIKTKMQMHTIVVHTTVGSAHLLWLCVPGMHAHVHGITCYNVMTSKHGTC